VTIADAPARPALRYLGGKWKLAPWIVERFPPHRVYVEPFGGAASVLLRKPRAFSEVYNDLDDEVVNLFQVMRDPELSRRLIADVIATPFARSEYEGAFERTTDPVERARRQIVRSFMGHGSNASNIDRTTGFRANLVNGDRALPALDWANLPPSLAQVAARFVGVVVERRPALQVIARYDVPDCLIYADPPYVHETRSGKRKGGELYCSYPVEMSDADHVELLEALVGSSAMVVLSGYSTPLYDEALRGWRCETQETHADGARPRVEALWINPQACAALDATGTQQSLFPHANDIPAEIGEPGK
jgi:DNA adenine methylase